MWGTVPDLRTEQSTVLSLVIARDELPRLSLRGAERRSNLKTDSGQAPQSQLFGDLCATPHIHSPRPLNFTLNGLNGHSSETCPRRSQSGNGNLMLSMPSGFPLPA